MSTYLSPGIFIEEVPSGPQPIAAAPTSVVAVLGTTNRGPVQRPVRVTGWSDFLRAFGGPMAGSVTAESVFGFFENGGPAAYVVRVDPSLAAEWRVDDTTGAESFRIIASSRSAPGGPADSPGAWANALAIGVVPDASGGSGQMYVGRIGAAASIPSATSTPVPMESGVGARGADEVTIVTTTATEDAVVDVAAADSLTLTKPSAGTFAVDAGDVVAGRADNGDTTLRLAVASGIKPGDLLVAELPDRTRVTALVAAAASEGAGLLLTLASGLSADIPGAQFTQRTTRYRGTIGAVGGDTVALGAVTWDDDPSLAPEPADVLSTSFRAFASNGLEGAWDPAVGVGAFRFPAEPPPGRIEIEAQLNVHQYLEAVNLPNPTLEQLTARFGFVPENTALLLTGGAGNATITRTATGFTTADSLADTFTFAEFVLPGNASLGVVVRSVRAPKVGDYVDFAGTLVEVTGFDSPGGNLHILHFTATDDLSAVTADIFPLMAFQETRFYPLRFAIHLTANGDEIESFTGLALDPSHPQYYFKGGIVNGVSEHIRVTERAPAPITAAALPAVVTQTRAGLDEPAGPGDYRAALEALETEPEPAMVICPETATFADDLVAADVIGAVVGHCERFRRLAIVDAPRRANDQDLVNWRNQTVSSTYASVYAPHVRITALDPDATDRFSTVPPSGFVAGVMARTDRERGVHKAPGNEHVRGVVGLDVSYTQRRQDLLNPSAVNLIRAFPGRGTRIWGARNATDDVQWRYTNVRRLFNFIENSVERGTQWVVFEPNTPSTWLRVKVSVENFLDALWRVGALAGTSADQAYRVRVGLGETMTEADIELGLVIVEVAIAAARPAEFVVFRFSHKRLSD